MVQKFGFLLILATLFSLGSPLYGAPGRPDGQSFYYRINPSVKTKGDLIRQIEKGLRIPIQVLASRVAKATGQDLKNKEDLILFIKSNEVNVKPCDWKDGEEVDIEYVVSKGGWEERRFSSWSRDCYSGEYVLSYRNKAFLSLICGNPIIDRRVTAVKPAQFPLAALPSVPAVRPSVKEEKAPEKVPEKPVAVKAPPLPKVEEKSVFKPCRGEVRKEVMRSESPFAFTVGISGGHWNSGNVFGAVTWRPSSEITTQTASCR